MTPRVRGVVFVFMFVKFFLGVDNRYEVCYNTYRNGENADERLTPRLSYKK